MSNEGPARAPIDLAPFTSAEEVQAYLRATRTWGRWGADDQRGAFNLIDDAARVRAAALVREGVAVSLSRPLATEPGPGNPRPVGHFMEKGRRKAGAGVARDYLTLGSHGTTTTHLDALSHVWDGDGLWGGADPDEAIQFDGARWGSIEHWRTGFFTRTVLLDVTAHRQAPYVTVDRPVVAAELEATLAETGLQLQPGDAIAVYSGRDRWDEDQPPYGSDSAKADESTRPGLDVSCLKFLHEHDVSLLAWDMTDSRPIAFGLAYGVHAAIYAYGVALIDSSELGQLVRTADRLGRRDFLLVVAPLYLRGGTATPVNPIAVF
ncbi:MAG TPA: cyclase family protein [Candidatus Limnocylindrales bacterium]|nr:cyclase family protein [Candidatus Limnocylindrales bacterium]